MSMGSLFLFVNSISGVQVLFVRSDLMRKKIQYPEKRIFSLESDMDVMELTKGRFYV